MSTTAPKPKRSAARAPLARKRTAEAQPIPVKNGTAIDPRSPWPFPISIGTEKIKE